MFPPMCLPAAESSDDAELQDILSEDELKVVESNPKFEPRFKIIEIYEKLTQKLKLRLLISFYFCYNYYNGNF